MTARSEHDHALGWVLAAIAFGGAVGAAARYGASVLLPPAPLGWPWATVLVNLSGCALVGVLMVLVAERQDVHPLLRPFLGVGVLGGYTTFSTYAVDAVVLADAGRLALALGYLVVTATGAVLAVALAAGAARAGATRARGGGAR
ncbi:MAG: fluoride efflux transporter CrcB [Nocardioidaceae bacterium]|nr:fluoride efflux transporter CrcB [Nocardioidaceae bacterium]